MSDNMREALEAARAELRRHDEEYHHRTPLELFTRIDAALASSGEAEPVAWQLTVGPKATINAIDFCCWLSGYVGHGPAIQISSDQLDYIRSKVHPLMVELGVIKRAAPVASCPEVTTDPLEDLVARFSKALLAKLKLAQANGRSGWEQDDWEEHCQRGLLRHVEKGDPRDVAAYCAFMWHHGWITRAAPVASCPDTTPVSQERIDQAPAIKAFITAPYIK